MKSYLKPFINIMMTLYDQPKLTGDYFGGMIVGISFSLGISAIFVFITDDSKPAIIHLVWPAIFLELIGRQIALHSQKKRDTGDQTIPEDVKV